MIVMERKRVVVLALLAWILHVLTENVTAAAGSSMGQEIADSASSSARARHIKYPEARAEFPSKKLFRVSNVGLKTPTWEAQERIINGNVVQDIKIFPQTVVIAEMNEVGTVFPICTGQLVDDYIVLTAAHCTIAWENANNQAAGRGLLVVCAGGTSFNEERDDYTCVSAAEGYVPGTYLESKVFDGGDLALLRLPESLLEVKGVQVSKVSFDMVLHGTLVQSVGYGTNTHDGTITDGVLRHVDAMVVDSSRCYLLAARGRVNDVDLVCMEGNYDGSGGVTCNGDSGGPLLVQGSTPEGNYVVGVTSWVVNTSSKRKQ